MSRPTINVQAGAIGFQNLDDVQAALTFQTEPGGTRVDEKWQSQISDITRLTGQFGNFVPDTPATGQPSRYLEEGAYPGGHEFVDPNDLQVNTPGTPGALGEKALFLKAMIGGMNFSLFNVEVTEQQGVFSGKAAKDFEKSIKNMKKTHEKKLWRGAANGPADSVSFEYAGVYNQLTAAGNAYTVSIAAGVSIVEKFNLVVAQMTGQEDIDVAPSHSFWHSLAYEALQRELRATQQTLGQVEVKPGVRVSAIATGAGDIPVIVDPFMGLVDIAPGTNNAWPIFICDVDQLEYHFLTTPEIRVFELGLAPGLAKRRVMLKFGAFVIKRADVAHALLKVADDWTP